MMMEDRYLATLEFFKIAGQLAEHTAFSAGRALALALRPSADAEEVRLRLQETTEAKALLSRRSDVSVGGARDVRPLMRRAELEAMLQPPELLEIRATLISARNLRNLLLRLQGEFPLLGEKAEGLEPLPEVLDEIGRCLDDEGRVLDAASPALARIRHEAAVARDRVVERLRRIVTSSRNAPFLQEAIITERNGRYVIPLKTEYKGRIPGIVHDQSSSGVTLFIEPLETVELNNRWHELQLEEVREVERILTELTVLVGREAEAITRDVDILAELDLAFAKGLYSFQLRAAPAELVAPSWPVAPGDGELERRQHPLNLIKARHPLLPHETVVPIDLYLGGNNTILVITGPNTGGKTVSLKTVGLLAAMSQAGMHIPAADGSRLPVFSGIYADIGDEQSIEQSLSTFSSHMTHIIDILKRADAGSLVLLDELGAGTDPVEGSALAQALIDTLLERGCLTICSSHYSQLKLYAFNTPRVENASVEFDVETLAPTYVLTIGLPGRSNALAIARRLGLDEEIVARARGMVSAEDLQADALLARVRAASEAAEEARTDAETGRTRARELEADLRRRLREVEETRQQVVDEARAQARRELEAVRSELRRLRASLPLEAPTARAASDALAEIDALAEAVVPVTPAEVPTAPSAETPRVGDTVYVSSLDQTGELVNVDGQEAEVRVGSFRLRTRMGALELRARSEPAAEPADRGVRAPDVESPGMELDLRGRRAEEVAPALDQYLDNAYLARLPWVRIIHGKGMGVLKQVVREFLADHPLVESYRPGDAPEGGEGVTVARLYARKD
jgi:DNA mismatch repair protein MutS2